MLAANEGPADRDPQASFASPVVAPDAYAYHDVWFDPPSIEDIRVHGLAERIEPPDGAGVCSLGGRPREANPSLFVAVSLW